MYTIDEKFTYTGTIIFIYQNLNSYRMVMNGNCIISLITAFICCLLTIIKCTYNDFNKHVNTLVRIKYFAEVVSINSIMNLVFRSSWKKW